MKYLIAFLSLTLSGCVDNYSVVRVVHSDAQAGSFTVIPSCTSDKDIKFAGVAEKTLMDLGVRVVERPPFKVLLPAAAKTEAADSGENTSLHAVTADGEAPASDRVPRLVDAVAMFNDTKADYIAVTYAELPNVFRRIRIIKRADKSVVASIDYPFNHDEKIGYTNESPVYSGLLAAGIIKGKGEVLSCGYAKPPR